MLLTGLLMFFNKGSLIQLTVGILLCVAFLTTVAWVQPFKSPAANTFKVGTVSEMQRAPDLAGCRSVSLVVDPWSKIST